jgi:hypothetical protein
MKLNPTFLEILLLLAITTTVYIWVRYGKKIARWWKELHKRHRGPQHLRPREPADCPACAIGLHPLPRRPRHDVVPWSEFRSPRGRKKQVETRGYACLNIWCHYFGVTDPAVHALVSGGWRGKNKDILYLRCQCCGTRKTSRAGKVMYRLKTPLHRAAMVMTALSEGPRSVRRLSRLWSSSHHPQPPAGTRWSAQHPPARAGLLQGHRRWTYPGRADHEGQSRCRAAVGVDCHHCQKQTHRGPAHRRAQD